MSERTRQEAIAAAIADLFQEGSVLINDYVLPQTSSRERAPWAIIAVGDEFRVEPGESWSTPATTWRIYLTLLDYRGGRNDAEFLDAFQALRQHVVNALVVVPHLVQQIEADSLIGPYFNDDLEPDPDSISQRLTIQVIDYEL